MDLVDIASDLGSRVKKLRFGPPVEWVYNPLHYAWRPHAEYSRRFGKPPKEVLFVGMNPGPWGMAQTGVPFGEITAVRDWLGISDRVQRPAREHPGRPVTGFECRRSEVSGRRVWGWARDRFGDPESFFARFFVANYCPLLFLDRDGRNLTPDRLPVGQRRPLEAICDRALRLTAEHLEIHTVVGVGAFGADRARHALDGSGIRIERILHPSPASPAANRGWAEVVDKQLASMGIEVPAPATRPSGQSSVTSDQ